MNFGRRGISKGALIGVVVAIIVVAAVAAFVFLMQPSGAPTTPTEEGVKKIVIYGGEISVSQYGYGFSPDELTSPGPDIMLKVGQKTQIILKNIGNLPHTMEVTNEKRFDAPPLFGAQIGTPTKPIQPGEEASATFIPKQEGEFLYICQVPGHIELGMWGKVVIEG